MTTKKETPQGLSELFHEMHQMKQELLHQGKLQKDAMEVLEGMNVSLAHLALSDITREGKKPPAQENIDTLMRIISRPSKKSKP